MIKQYTHGDLDGVGCSIILSLVYGSDLDVEVTNYDRINNDMLSFINGGNIGKYDKVYITDISVSDEVASKLDGLHKDVTLIDHHATALDLNKYAWAQVVVNAGDMKYSATSLVRNAYRNKLDEAIYRISCNTNKDKSVVASHIDNIVELIRRYDTWDWLNYYDFYEQDDTPKQLNDLMKLMGFDRFLDLCVNRIKRVDNIISDREMFLLDLEDDRKRRYIDSKLYKLVRKYLYGYKAGIVYADQYVSELGNSIVENYSCDFAMIISMDGTVSLRSKGDIDVSEIAKGLGGGGHKAAAGFPITEKTLQDVTNNVLCGLLGEEVVQ